MFSQYCDLLKKLSTSKSASLIQTDDKKHLINLIDCAGHVDFKDEMFSAVRLCDGAIVVVDVIEGVSSQTMAALRQAWLERVKPILVFNKLDQLLVNKKMPSLDV